MIVYALFKREKNNYFNTSLVKITRSKRIKNKWIKRKGHLFQLIRMRKP